MDFFDWRNVQSTQDKLKAEQQKRQGAGKMQGKAYQHYIEEQIRDAEERGVFKNLPGYGKPLKLDDNPYAGDKALGYSLLKSNGYAPAEVELIKEIRADRERLEKRLERVVQRKNYLRSRRVPPFPSERRAFNTSVEKAANEYACGLRELNRKILTLNVKAPPALHQQMLDIDRLIAQFRASCPLYTDVM